MGRGSAGRPSTAGTIYTMIEDGNRVVLCADVDDLDTFFKVLESQDAEDAKQLDGVHRETIKFFVLDKQFKF